MEKSNIGFGNTLVIHSYSRLIFIGEFLNEYGKNQVKESIRKLNTYKGALVRIAIEDGIIRIRNHLKKNI